jgi:hypothetical protein
VSRFHRTPPAGAPWGFTDLPVHFPGEITDGLFPAFVAHATPHDVDELTRPWTGRNAHPRCAIARQVIRSHSDVELGWRTAVELAPTQAAPVFVDEIDDTTTPDTDPNGVVVDLRHLSGELV